MTGGRRAAGAAVLAALALVGACGVPTGGTPTTIPASDIPYGLAAPSPTPSASASVVPQLDPSRVFLVGKGDVLVARSREIEGATREERLEQLLAALADGPSEVERSEELSTELSPEVRLSLVELSDGAVTIDIDGPAEAPSGGASRRAVGQIVLTATSVPGVDTVRLTLAGEPVEAPLPSNEVTSRPLTAADYAPLLVAEASSPS